MNCFMLYFVFYVCKCFTYTVCLYTMFIPGSHRVQRRALDPQELEVVVRFHVGARNWNWVRWRSSKAS